MSNDNIFVTSSGKEIPVIVETRRGIRNITLRPRTAPHAEIRMSKPWLVTTATALRFLESKRAWVERYFARAPQKVSIRDGDTIEFLGRIVMIRHVAKNVAPRFILDSVILEVGGSAEHLERRVRDFIKSELAKEIKKLIKESWPCLTPLAGGASAQPTRGVKRIALRDTTSRWGSCSTSGTISFSWRLAFAPYDVMRYVVMHELAHCRHMDHSPQFWATVAALYGPGVLRAKRWLAQNGAELHKYF